MSPNSFKVLVIKHPDTGDVVYVTMTSQRDPIKRLRDLRNGSFSKSANQYNLPIGAWFRDLHAEGKQAVFEEVGRSNLRIDATDLRDKVLARHADTVLNRQRTFLQTLK